MEFYANLLLHSTHSDGVLTPEELVIAAKGEGYKALAITDHDTATAYPELKEACQKHHMDCIFGTEFSVFEPVEAHLVAFHYDPEYPEMKKYLSDMAWVCETTTKGCFDEAVEKGNISGITWQEVLDYNKGIKWLCNNHVFRAMQAKGLVRESEYMAWFLKNFEAQRAKYKPDFTYYSAPQMIDLVHRAGGIILIAHPVQVHYDLEDMIETFVEWGIDGIEVEHPDLNREQRDKYMKIAQKHNFLISGGSDHSGLCSGLYGSYPDEETLKKSHTYIEPLSCGTSYEYYMQIKNLAKR